MITPTPLGNFRWAKSDVGTSDWKNESVEDILATMLKKSSSATIGGGFSVIVILALNDFRRGYKYDCRTRKVVNRGKQLHEKIIVGLKIAKCHLCKYFCKIRFLFHFIFIFNFCVFILLQFYVKFSCENNFWCDEFDEEKEEKLLMVMWMGLIVYHASVHYFLETISNGHQREVTWVPYTWSFTIIDGEFLNVFLMFLFNHLFSRIIVFIFNKKHLLCLHHVRRNVLPTSRLLSYKVLIIEISFIRCSKNSNSDLSDLSD